MNLHPEWRKILRYAWSVRLWALSAVLMMIEPVADVVLSMSDGLSPPVRLIIAVLAGLAGFGGIVARFIPQQNLRPPHKQYEDEQWDA